MQIARIPIVVDTAEYRILDSPQGDPYVLIAVSEGYTATVDFVLGAMPTVWQAFPRCRLIVTGVSSSGALQRRLLSRFGSSVVGQRVVLPGYVGRSELLDLYSGSRALLAPLFDDVASRARFPSKIAEYLASARPVVTCEVGEVSRVLRDGVNAYVARPGSPQYLAAKIIQVLDDPGGARQIGLTGRDLAVSAPLRTLRARAARARGGVGRAQVVIEYVPISTS